MIDNKKLKEWINQINKYPTLDDVRGITLHKDDMEELFKMAQVGLWAKERAIPVLKAHMCCMSCGPCPACEAHDILKLLPKDLK